MRCTRKDWVPRRTSTRRYSGTNVPAAMGNAFAKRRLADIEREQAGAEKATARRRTRAREAAEANGDSKRPRPTPRQNRRLRPRNRKPTSRSCRRPTPKPRVWQRKGRGRSQGATCQEKPEDDPAKARGAPAAILEQVRRIPAGTCQGRRSVLLFPVPRCKARESISPASRLRGAVRRKIHNSWPPGRRPAPCPRTRRTSFCAARGSPPPRSSGP